MSDTPANMSTTQVLTSTQTAAGAIDFRGDRDWVRLDLAAGEWMQVFQRGVGPNALSDALIRVYDSDGHLITADDEIAASNTDFDAGVIFGGGDAATYYIEAAAYRDRSVGDYELMAQVVPMPSGGPVASLNSGRARSDREITVHFVQAGERAAYGYRTGDRQDDITSEGWNSYEQSRVLAALASISAVTNLTFTVTSDRNADFQLVLDTNELNNNGLLGYFYMPSGTRPSVGVLNGNGIGWDRTAGGGLDTGGLGYATIVHELLHGLGLAHPHDSAQPISGVHVPFGDLGANGLNQGLYSTMSYNPGNADFGGFDETTGNEAGPMVLDIAALQALYGTNMQTALGDDTYTIPEAGQVAWQAIWDAGGYDEIVYGGSRDSTIDLRAASLTYEMGGGGFISAANGIAGGFTIAHGVIIEAAISGSGHDRLIGNAADNLLDGGAGDDALVGGIGADTLIGGTGGDRLSGASGADQMDAGADNDQAWGGAGDDRIDGGSGDDTLIGNAGADTLFADSGNNIFYGSGGADQITGGTGSDTIYGGTGDDALSGAAGNDSLLGGRGRDVIDGGDGDDRIDGGWGADQLTGGLGADTFVFAFLSDSAPDQQLRDTITDFDVGIDLIDLSIVDADLSVDGDQAFDFSGTDGQVRVEVDGSDAIIHVDRNSDGVADMIVAVIGVTNLTAADFIL